MSENGNESSIFLSTSILGPGAPTHHSVDGPQAICAASTGIVKIFEVYCTVMCNKICK